MRIQNDNQDKIKIMFVIDYFYGYGGTERHLTQLLKNLDKSKFKLYLWPLRFEHELINRIIPEDCTVFQHHIDRIYNYKGLKTAYEFYKFLKHEKIDIVHTFHFDSEK